MKTFGELTVGSVVNYNKSIVAENVNYVILKHFTDRFGDFTKVLNLNTLELDEFTQNTKIQNDWYIVKEN